MPTLEQVKFDKLFCMFKGEPGTRKSTQALSFPKPQYWFSVDKKMSSILLPAKKWGISSNQIEFDDYTDYTQMKAKMEQLQMNCKFKTIVVDSVTSVGDMINIGTIKSKKGAKNKEGEQKGQVIGGIMVNDLSDYKAEAAAFNEIVSLLKDVSGYHKCNIILIAHVIGARKADDEIPITHFSRVIVTGGQAISAKIPAYCDEVYHFNITKSVVMDKEGSYGLYTVHTGHDFARTSLMLDPHIDFNDRPLYDTYIVPAIKKTEELQPTFKI